MHAPTQCAALDEQLSISAVWGFIGYACIAAGTLLELFGVAGAGIVGAIPGGLFELTFGIWLIARGFASTATVPSRARTAVAPA